MVEYGAVRHGTLAFLFIGGPKAGQVMDVAGNSLRVVVPGRLLSEDPIGDDGRNISAGFICEYTYFRRFITDKTGREHAVFVYADCDPIIELMKFYAEGSHS